MKSSSSTKDAVLVIARTNPLFSAHVDAKNLSPSFLSLNMLCLYSFLDSSENIRSTGTLNPFSTSAFSRVAAASYSFMSGLKDRIAFSKAFSSSFPYSLYLFISQGDNSDLRGIISEDISKVPYAPVSLPNLSRGNFLKTFSYGSSYHLYSRGSKPSGTSSLKSLSISMLFATRNNSLWVTTTLATDRRAPRATQPLPPAVIHEKSSFLESITPSRSFSFIKVLNLSSFHSTSSIMAITCTFRTEI